MLQKDYLFIYVLFVYCAILSRLSSSPLNLSIRQFTISHKYENDELIFCKCEHCVNMKAIFQLGVVYNVDDT